MRRLQRPAISLPTLTGHGPGAKETEKRIADWATNHQLDVVTKAFPAHWGRADVRGALYAMHGRACAYCQRHLPGNDRGAVEHFRPKSIYWWLAYDFNNYFLSCTPCNSHYKRDQFPLAPHGVHVGYDEKDQLDDSTRLLMDPVVDPVQRWLTVDFEALSADPSAFRKSGIPVSIAPDIAPGSPVYHRCRETLNLFKLNTDVELMRERVRTVDQIRIAFERLQAGDNDDENQRLELKKMASHYAPHGFIARAFFALVDERLIPTPVEELAWLLQSFFLELNLANSILAQYPHESKATEQKTKVCWGLAVLWKTPPTGSANIVRTWLEQAELRHEVQPYYDALIAADPSSMATT